MTDDSRLVTGAKRDADDAEPSLRPQMLREFIGQEQARSNLKVFIEAAKARGDALDHVLFAGPPGLGKTTLAQIMARELGVGFRSTSGPVIAKAGDLAALLTNLEDRDVLFIDEIHRLNPAIEEILYPAMEDYQLDLIIGEGPAARSVRIDLARFTLIGATTRTGLLTTPLRDRFGVTHRLELYGPAELGRIVRRSAGILDVEIDDEGAEAIASRSRGTPRVANRLLKRVRDFAEVRGEGRIDVSVAREGLDMLEVDALGLDRLDRDILRAVCQKFAGGPVGLSTLAVSVSEEPDTLEDVYEPYLLQQGLLMRTPRGRVATEAAFRHLGLDRHDRTILETIAVKFSGGPVGLSTLAAAVDEEAETIEDVYEPYLLQQGLIKRTPRGRVATPRAFEHLGLDVPERAASLF